MSRLGTVVTLSQQNFWGENAMSDALSFTEVYRQHVELLPARTVLSTFLKGKDTSTGGTGSTSSGDAVTQIMGPILAGMLPH